MKRRLFLMLAVALGVAGWQAGAALGTDNIYWDSASNPSAVRVGNLDGTGSASSLFGGENGPIGVAIDPAAGKIFWASSSGTIRVGNLNGSGTPLTLFSGENVPQGLAIDPAAGKLYWTDVGDGTIRVGNLDGTGTPQTLYSGESSPEGIAIDPADGKLYWADDVASGALRVGNLAGGGTPQNVFSAAESFPFGVALDTAAAKIYWTDTSQGVNPGAVRVGNLDGTGARDLFPNEGYTVGVAVDPSAGRIYWIDTGNDLIRAGNLSGSGSPQTLFANENAFFPAVLRSPVAAGAPVVSGGSGPGAMLSCSDGSWAPDLVGAFTYRAPQSFTYQWALNGVDIAGATSTSYIASSPGSYTCRVAASNQAGSSSPQTSTAHVVTSAAASPTLSSVVQTHRRWRLGNALPHVAAVRKPPVGTTFRFTLNESASVRFAFTQKLPGRKVGNRCVAPTANNRHKPKCARIVIRGTLSFQAGAVLTGCASTVASPSTRSSRPAAIRWSSRRATGPARPRARP